MAQQTAVEWIAEKMEKLTPPGYQIAISIMLDKAKEMEKQQIMDAHLTGLIHPLETEATKQAEQYYNETFGN